MTDQYSYNVPGLEHKLPKPGQHFRITKNEGSFSLEKHLEDAAVHAGSALHPLHGHVKDLTDIIHKHVHSNSRMRELMKTSQDQGGGLTKAMKKRIYLEVKHTLGDQFTVPKKHAIKAVLGFLGKKGGRGEEEPVGKVMPAARRRVAAARAREEEITPSHANALEAAGRFGRSETAPSVAGPGTHFGTGGTAQTKLVGQGAVSSISQLNTIPKPPPGGTAQRKGYMLGENTLLEEPDDFKKAA